MVFAAQQHNALKITVFALYGTALVLLYLASAFYHGLEGRAKNFFRQLDFYAIYLLIAGTYTPLTLVVLAGAWGWSLFGAIWFLAAIGMTQEAVFGHKTRQGSLIIYLLMGWLIVMAAYPLAGVLPLWGWFWLVLGGLFYTGGVWFYVKDEIIRHGHGIWHLFVLAGSASHFVLMLLYVL